MKVKACPKCGKVNYLRAWNCGYSSFDVSGVTCDNKKCGYKLTFNYATMDVAACFKAWNLHIDKALKKAKARVKELERKKKKMGASQKVEVDLKKGNVLP